MIAQRFNYLTAGNTDIGPLTAYCSFSRACDCARASSLIRSVNPALLRNSNARGTIHNSIYLGTHAACSAPLNRDACIILGLP
jgi:hypothetical protein